MRKLLHDTSGYLGHSFSESKGPHSVLRTPWRLGRIWRSCFATAPSISCRFHGRQILRWFPTWMTESSCRIMDRGLSGPPELLASTSWPFEDANGIATVLCCQAKPYCWSSERRRGGQHRHPGIEQLSRFGSQFSPGASLAQPPAKSQVEWPRGPEVSGLSQAPAFKTSVESQVTRAATA